MSNYDHVFQNFINGDLVQQLDAADISGVNCKVVHPLLTAMLQRVTQEETQMLYGECLTDLQRQIRECLSEHMVNQMLEKDQEQREQISEASGFKLLVSAEALYEAFLTGLTFGYLADAELTKTLDLAPVVISVPSSEAWENLLLVTKTLLSYTPSIHPDTQQELPMKEPRWLTQARANNG